MIAEVRTIHFIFDPEVIHSCAMKGLGHPRPEPFDVMAQEVEKRYPGHIDRDQPGTYSIAWGAMITVSPFWSRLQRVVEIC